MYEYKQCTLHLESEAFRSRAGTLYIQNHKDAVLDASIHHASFHFACAMYLENRILYIQYEVVNLVDIRHTLKR